MGAKTRPTHPIGGAPTVEFSGYTWAIKSSAGLVGPGPNVFSARRSNVWIGDSGQLHLRITNRDERWLCAEVILNHSLGYGAYCFSVSSPIGALDPNVVLGLFIWSDDPAYNHREVDIEFARWANLGDPTNAQYVVHPDAQPGHVRRFSQPTSVAPSLHGFSWTPKGVSFVSATSSRQPIARWMYTGADVPQSGDERPHMNLWLDGAAPPTDGAEVEVVLSAFTFTQL